MCMHADFEGAKQASTRIRRWAHPAQTLAARNFASQRSRGRSDQGGAWAGSGGGNQGSQPAAALSILIVVSHFFKFPFMHSIL